MTLDASRIPRSAVGLVHEAERWGIGDDFDREQAVRRASDDELNRLASALDGVEGDFWEWLSGPESFDPQPSNEFLAFSALTMAVDSARLKVSHRTDLSTGSN